MLRLYLYARVRVLVHILHARPRVQQAPGVPCALFRAKDSCMPRAFRAARTRMYVGFTVIASEAKQSISPRKERMDCFVALLLAMTALNPLNRFPRIRHRRGQAAVDRDRLAVDIGRLVAGEAQSHRP